MELTEHSNSSASSLGSASPDHCRLPPEKFGALTPGPRQLAGWSPDRPYERRGKSEGQRLRFEFRSGERGRRSRRHGAHGRPAACWRIAWDNDTCASSSNPDRTRHQAHPHRHVGGARQGRTRRRRLACRSPLDAARARPESPTADEVHDMGRSASGAPCFDRSARPKVRTCADLAKVFTKRCLIGRLVARRDPERSAASPGSTRR